jgi:hypothetical protein
MERHEQYSRIVRTSHDHPGAAAATEPLFIITLVLQPRVGHWTAASVSKSAFVDNPVSKMTAQNSAHHHTSFARNRRSFLSLHTVRPGNFTGFTALPIARARAGSENTI